MGNELRSRVRERAIRKWGLPFPYMDGGGVPARFLVTIESFIKCYGPGPVFISRSGFLLYRKIPFTLPIGLQAHQNGD